MGFPNSEVGYTPAMPRREDHEVHKGHVVALDQKKKHLHIFPDQSRPKQCVVLILSTNVLEILEASFFMMCEICLVQLPQPKKKTARKFVRIAGTPVVSVRFYRCKSEYTQLSTHRDCLQTSIWQLSCEQSRLSTW